MQDLSRDGVDSFTLGGQEGDRVSDITKSHHEDEGLCLRPETPRLPEPQELVPEEEQEPTQENLQSSKSKFDFG